MLPTFTTEQNAKFQSEVSEKKKVVIFFPSKFNGTQVKNGWFRPCKRLPVLSKAAAQFRTDGDDLRIRRFLYAMQVYHASHRAESGVQMRVLEVLHTAASGINKLQS